MILSFILFCAQAIAGVSDCPDLQKKELQTLLGKPAVVVPPNPANQTAFVKLVQEPGTLAIGITERPSHFFFSAEYHSFNASPLRYGSFRPANPKETPRGLYFVFDSLPEAVRAKLKEHIATKDASMAISCVHGACRRLNQAGLTINDGKGLPIRLSDSVERLILSEVVDTLGTSVPKEIVLYSDLSFEQFFTGLKNRDESILQTTFTDYSRSTSGVIRVIRALRDAEEEVRLAAIAEIRTQDETVADFILLELESGAAK